MALKHDGWKMIRMGPFVVKVPKFLKPGKLCEISGGVGGLELQLGWVTLLRQGALDFLIKNAESNDWITGWVGFGSDHPGGCLRGTNITKPWERRRGT